MSALEEANARILELEAQNAGLRNASNSQSSASGGSGSAASGSSGGAQQGMLANRLPAADMSRLVIFRGTTKDTVTAEAWADMVDRFVTVLNWDSKQTAGAAVEAMRDDALTWVSNLKNDFDSGRRALVEDWQLLKPEFLKRFEKYKSRAARIQGLGTLRMMPTEDTVTYFDRLMHVCNKVVKHKISNYQDGTGEHKAFLDCYDDFVSAVFLHGLRAEIRMHVEMDLKDEDNARGIFERARAIEHGFMAKKAAVAVLAHDMPEVPQAPQPEGSQQVAASSLKSKGKGKATPRAPASASFSRRSPAKPARSVEGRSRPIFCFKCKQWGLHYRNECMLSDKECAALTPQDRNQEPASVYDAQYRVNSTQTA